MRSRRPKLEWQSSERVKPRGMVFGRDTQSAPEDTGAGSQNFEAEV